jgi:hypothetical protein
MGRGNARGINENCPAIGLMTPTFKKAASLLALVLLGVFTTAIRTTVVRRNRVPDCGCCSALGNPRWAWALLVRNVALGVLAAEGGAYI